MNKDAAQQFYFAMGYTGQHQEQSIYANMTWVSAVSQRAPKTLTVDSLIKIQITKVLWGRFWLGNFTIIENNPSKNTQNQTNKRKINK